jgi:hypothetical protein
MYTKLGRRMSAFSFMLVALFFIAGTADVRAQSESEAERLSQCSRDLCDMLRMPLGDGSPLRCEVGVALQKEQIDKAMRQRSLMWPLGDARCTVKLDVERAIIARTMTQDRYTLKLPKQPATCEVEYKGAKYPVTLALAPEIEFRGGRATSVRLGVQDIQANLLLKAAIWSAAKLEDRVGVFQSAFVSGVNGYIGNMCKAKPATRRQAGL